MTCQGDAAGPHMQRIRFADEANADGHALARSGGDCRLPGGRRPPNDRTGATLERVERLELVGVGPAHLLDRAASYDRPLVLARAGSRSPVSLERCGPLGLPRLSVDVRFAGCGRRRCAEGPLRRPRAARPARRGICHGDGGSHPRSLFTAVIGGWRDSAKRAAMVKGAGGNGCFGAGGVVGYWRGDNVDLIAISDGQRPPALAADAAVVKTHAQSRRRVAAFGRRAWLHIAAILGRL